MTLSGARPHPTTPPAHLARLLADVSVVLLDFDGPTCHVFAGYPAHDIADELQELLTLTHGLVLPEDVAATLDPMLVLRRTVDLAPELVPVVEDALQAAELRAVASSEPTPGTVELLQACRATGRTVAIVSNNSAPAIHAYLRRLDLTEYVVHVQGRVPADPARMKPHPYALVETLAVLDVPASAAVLIGDSRADIDGARAAGVPVVAYANDPAKLVTLADADAIVTDITHVAQALGR